MPIRNVRPIVLSSDFPCSPPTSRFLTSFCTMTPRFTADFLEVQSYKELQSLIKELKANNPDDQQIQRLNGRRTRKALIKSLLALELLANDADEAAEGSSAPLMQVSCQDDDMDVDDVQQLSEAHKERLFSPISNDLVASQGKESPTPTVPARNLARVGQASFCPAQARHSKDASPGARYDDRPASKEQQMINRWMRGPSVIPAQPGPLATSPPVESISNEISVNAPRSTSRSPTPTPTARPSSPARQELHPQVDSDSDNEMVLKGFPGRKRRSIRDYVRPSSLEDDAPATASLVCTRPPEPSPRMRFSDAPDDEDRTELCSDGPHDAWLQKASQATIPEDAAYSQELESSQQQSQEERIQEPDVRKARKLACPEIQVSDEEGLDVGVDVADHGEKEATPRPEFPILPHPIATRESTPEEHRFRHPPDEDKRTMILDFMTQYMQTLLKYGRIIQPEHKDAILDALTKAWNSSVFACNLETAKIRMPQIYPVPDVETLPDVSRPYFSWELPERREEDWFKRRKLVFPFVEDPRRLGHFSLPDWIPAWFHDGAYHARPDTPPPANRQPRQRIPRHNGPLPEPDSEDEADPMVLKSFYYKPKKKQVDADAPVPECLAPRPVASATVRTSTAGPSRHAWTPLFELPRQAGVAKGRRDVGMAKTAAGAGSPQPSRAMLGKRVREDSQPDSDEEPARPPKRVEGVWGTRR